MKLISKYRRLSLEGIRVTKGNCKLCNKNCTGKEVSECTSCESISHIKCLPKSLRKLASSDKIKCDACVRSPPLEPVAFEDNAKNSSQPKDNNQTESIDISNELDEPENDIILDTMSLLEQKIKRMEAELSHEKQQYIERGELLKEAHKEIKNMNESVIQFERNWKVGKRKIKP